MYSEVTGLKVLKCCLHFCWAVPTMWDVVVAGAASLSAQANPVSGEIAQEHAGPLLWGHLFSLTDDKTLIIPILTHFHAIC